MYEAFGFSQAADGSYLFQLFVPDNTIAPSQYSGGDSPRIASVVIAGTFQPAAGVGAAWDMSAGLKMTPQPNTQGLMFTASLPAGFPEGYYEYKYYVTFQNGTQRWVGDPCTKYGGTNNDNSAFVIGGSDVSVAALDPAKRSTGADLVLYELMIDDFTIGYRENRAPVDAVVDKLSYIEGLGANAIEFMPWIAWPDSEGFSWGYNPAYFFSAEYNYVNDSSNQLEKLSKLGNMISACHNAGLMVVMDIVLQHANDGGGSGFPYFWLWQDTTQSPFAGGSTPGGTSLNYSNKCTLQFATDVCTYWVDRFKIDGFRFDQVSGFDNPADPSQGAPAIISGLKTYLAAENNSGFAMILEDLTDNPYDTVNNTNQIGATHGWFDMFRWYPAGYLQYGGQPATDYPRVLNSAYQYNFPIGPVIYIESHDHSSVTNQAGGREWWFRVQPYMIALATCPGAVMLANGQEFGRAMSMPEPGAWNASDRVQSRPLDWSQATDATGKQIEGLYTFLLGLRQQHAALRSPNFYPNYYDLSWNDFSPDGYGLDVDKQVMIYHRWGNSASGQLEHFIVVPNFSAWQQNVSIPFPVNGNWVDLINGNAAVQVGNYWLSNYPVNSYWGSVFYLQVSQ